MIETNPTPSPYEDLLLQVAAHGTTKTDRTGTGTSSLFGLQMRWNLAKGFPLVTTKKVHIKSVVTELLWMLSGSTNVKDLQAMGCTIWDEWAQPDGSLGPVYGKQWRSWRGKSRLAPATEASRLNVTSSLKMGNDGWALQLTEEVDQIYQAVKGIKENPDGRRHVVSAWNVGELSDMALAPCHCLFQFYVANNKLSCQLYQRSADMFLGVPFNIASYALLTHMVAQQCDLEVGDFIWTGGDCHIYSNHAEQVALQLGRTPLPCPTLNIKRKPDSIFDYQFEDFEFVNYQHHSAIKAPVAI